MSTASASSKPQPSSFKEPQNPTESSKDKRVQNLAFRSRYILPKDLWKYDLKDALANGEKLTKPLKSHLIDSLYEDISNRLNIP